MADMAHLIEPVIPALRRYARTFVRDAADADDLVQDTLERAISRWHQRRSDGETRTWLFTILHNLAVNHLRRAARRGRVPWTMPASQMLACRRHRRTRCGVTISWGPLDSYPTTSAASYFSFPSKTRATPKQPAFSTSKLMEGTRHGYRLHADPSAKNSAEESS